MRHGNAHAGLLRPFAGFALFLACLCHELLILWPFDIFKTSPSIKLRIFYAPTPRKEPY